MAGRKAHGGGALWILTALVYVALLTAFMLDFVFLNSSPFILYSFIFFLIFGVLLGMHAKWISPAVLVSMAFIVVSAIMYMTNAALQQFVWLNLSIIGYYLLISAVIGLLIDALVYNAEIKRRVSSIGERISARFSKKGLRYAPLIVALLLMAAPVWPSGPLHFPQNSRVVYAAYYGNTTTNSSFLLISDPPPYQYVVDLCTSGTNAVANVSIESGTPVQAFLFRNQSALSNAINKSAGYPFSKYAGIFKEYAASSAYSDGTTGVSSVTVPNYSCSYMALLYDNLTSVRISYSIRYYGLIYGYKTVKTPDYSAPYEATGTSSMVNGMTFLTKSYAWMVNSAELEGRLAALNAS